MKAASNRIRLDPALILLLVAAFLTPLIGGQLALEIQPILGGFGAALASVPFDGTEAPTLAHFILGALSIGAFLFVMLGRRVVQVPNNTLTSVLLLFLGLLSATVLISDYKAYSLQIATEWLCYGIALFAVVGSAGRRLGPVALIFALFSGCVLLALKGILEYRDNKALYPTWRIFAGWNNPNALAVMLLIGFFLGAGLLLTQDRIGALVAGFGSVVVGLAIALTGSKGAILVLVPGVLIFLGLTIALSERPRRGVVAARGAALLVGLIFCAALLQISQRATPAADGAPGATPAPPAGSALSRLTDAGSTSEQSVEFRKLLWKTSIALVRENPVGFGVGSFRFVSGRPGLTTQTGLAHNSYLQMAVEGSVFLCLGFVGFVGFWTRLVFRGIRTLPEPSRLLLLSLCAAVFAVLAHAFVDSDFSFFGTGLSVFLLMGVGLLLSADSVAPEFLIPGLRRIAAGLAVVIFLFFGYFSYVEILRGEAKGELMAGHPDAGAAALSTLESIAPEDGETWYLAAQAARSSSERMADAVRAVQYAPTTRNFRYLARLQLAQNDIGPATFSYQRALRLDPNNLTSLLQLGLLQLKNGDADAAKLTLERLIGVEHTSYFEVRSLPEMVPTETDEARLLLADATNDVATRIKLLKEAVDGYLDYVRKTVPNILQMAKSDPPMDYGGESIESAREKLKKAADAATRLAELDQKQGRAADAKTATDAAAAFQAALPQ